MKLSVIIPCYNCAETIERALDSIIAQNCENLEVIICDDHSTDNSIEICHTYDDKLNMVYTETKPHGMHCPNNTRLDGLEVATGDWITFMDDDDTFVADKFNTILAVIEQDLIENPDNPHGMVATNCAGINDDTNEQVDLFGATSSCLLHGKFFNRQYLIDHDLTPRENVFIYEDILFLQRFNAYQAVVNSNFIAIDDITYEWRLNKNSFSHWLDPQGIDFDWFYFDYWVYANTFPFYEAWEKYHVEESRGALLTWACQALLGYYFLYMILINDPTFAPRYYRLKVKEVVKNITRIFNTDLEEVIMRALADPEIYDGLRLSTGKGRGQHFIETKSFHQFIRDIWNDEYESDYIVNYFMGGPNEQQSV